MKLHSRLWALLLAAILLVGLVPGAVAETAERKTVTIGLPLDTKVVDYDTNALTLYIEEEMNIDIEFFLFDDIAQKLPVMVSSGSELPDMILHNLDNASVINWTAQGVFVPLTEYWNNPEMTKNFDTALETQGVTHLRDMILSAVTMPDGEIYTVPTLDEKLWNLLCYRTWMNTDWLDKLGLEIPTTADEFADVLRHFVNDDPNGNGIKDEIGLTGFNNTYGGNPLVWLMNAFIHVQPDYNYMNVENGKVVPAFTQDAYKAGLEFINGLYAEGLIDPLGFTQDQTQMRAVLNAEVPVVGVLAAGSFTHFQGDLLKSYTLLDPVTGPEGVRFAASKSATIIPRVFITTYAEDPELCFKIAEFQYDFHAHLRNREGVEGVNWTQDPEILENYMTIYDSLGYKPAYVLLKDVWNQPYNDVYWGTAGFPWISSMYDRMTSITKERTPENEAYVDPEFAHYNNYVPCSPAELLGDLIHTEAENEIVAATQPTIKSYVEEMNMAFITGSRSFDQWDAFQNELLAMGLEDYVSALQAAYDRKTK